MSDDVEPEDPRIRFGSDKLSADLYDPGLTESYQQYYWERLDQKERHEDDLLGE